MKYCSSCGSPIGDEDHYCPCCGTKLYEDKFDTQNSNSYISTNSTNSYSSISSTQNDDPFASLNNNETTANADNATDNKIESNVKEEPKPDYNESASTLTKVLSFLFPTVGLILFVYWCRDYKVKAREVGTMALISYAICTVITFILSFILRNAIMIILSNSVPQLVGLIA